MAHEAPPEACDPLSPQNPLLSSHLDHLISPLFLMHPAHPYLRAFAHAVSSAQSTLCELLSPFDPSGKVQREEVMCPETYGTSEMIGIPSQARLTIPPPKTLSHQRCHV